MASEIQKAIEEYAKEYAKESEENGRNKKAVEIVKNLLKRDLSLEEALKCAEIDLSIYEKFAK